LHASVGVGGVDQSNPVPLAVLCDHHGYTLP
jgi:hypothetical protein